MEHEALIAHFYEGFQRLDWKQMQSCYHADIHFSDPVFPELHGDEAGKMWRMLCERAQDFSLSYSGVRADAQAGTCQWTARYCFTKTGRRVENHVMARFTFAEGKILTHHDTFDFWRWARQALGTPGLLLGWTPFLKQKVRQNAATQLARFQPVD